MKYIKTYEDLDDLKIGDYVICICCDLALDTDVREKITTFLENNIGKIVSNSGNRNRPHLPERFFRYPIAYENVPKNLKRSFNSYNYRYMQKREILYHAKSIEDCKVYLASKKYNI